MADQKLVGFVDRLVRLGEEKREIADSIKDIYVEVKAAGYMPAALRIVVRERLETAEQADKRKLRETEAQLMREALGDFASAPLGEAAIKKARAA